MRNAIIAVCGVLFFGTAVAEPEARQKHDEPISKQEFHEIVRDAHLFREVDANSDGFVDRTECRKTRLACDWDELARAHEEQLGADEFYERAYEAYDKAARALRARPAP